MPRRSLFHIETGRLTGEVADMPLEAFALNTPPGYAWVDAVCNHLAEVVQLITDDMGDSLPVACQQQPPAPAADQWITWEWDEAAACYVERPTEQALARDARQMRDRLLLECDWVSNRARDRGEAIPEDWLAYREALRAVPEQPGFPTAIDWPTPPAP